MTAFDQTILQRFPRQFTVRAVLLGMVLSVVLAAANAYLGLFAGMTVSASIPAAVVSMAVLRWFRNVNVLEHNIVQTTASAGEAIAAGAIFTLPALVIMDYWQDFYGPWVILICGVGGLLGVLFTIPLRHALIIEQKLPFPEGAATAAVLQAGEGGGAQKGVRVLLWGAIAGGVAKLADTGLRLWPTSIGAGYSVGPGVAYFGVGLSPALLSVGYIVGLNIALLIFMGGLFSWLIALPLHAMFVPMSLENVDVADAAWELWRTRIRYLGVGAMLVGGLWALWSIRPALVEGLRRVSGSTADTERDLPRGLLLMMMVLLVLPMYLFYRHVLDSSLAAVPLTIVMLAAAFVFSAVAGYMAGLVGSSNNPISGVTIATILVTALLLLWFFRGQGIGAVGAVLVGAVVCCAAAIGGDTLQDLKAGALLRASPWKQQVAQMLGVVSAVFVIAPVLSLLMHAYGIGGSPTATHPNPLPAPQANLMAAIAGGVFGGGLPWVMVGLGAVLGVLIIICDEVLRAGNSSFRVPVLAVAVGIYLPIEVSAPIALGGVVAGIARQRSGARGVGMLAAAGLITGEALMGIALAVPIVLSGTPKALDIRRLLENSPELLKALALPWNAAIPIMILLALAAWMTWLGRTSQEPTGLR
jgi:putative OPT family oligopeptide transporter